nr:translin associated factor X interacting protein [Hymenolepis microstoma]
MKEDINKFGITDDVSNPLRQQLFGEIFYQFISECNHYGPLLAKIKKQYEGYINHLQQTIKEILPIKEILWESSFDADKRLSEFQNRENAEINWLKSEIDRDKVEVEMLKQESTELNQKVSKLMKELEQKEEAYTFEADGRKLLISEVNDLNSRLNEMETMVRAQMDQDAEDPVKLKIMVGNYEKALEQANSELIKFRTDFIDRVPIDQYEEVNKQLVSKNRQVESLKEELDSAANRYSLLKDHCETLTTWRDLYNIQLIYIRRVLASKSDPAQKLEYIKSLISKYYKVARDKTAEELTEFVALELAKAGSMK